MDSDDPEQRIRELERRLADAKGGPREYVPAVGAAGPAPDAWVPQPPSVNPPNYELLRRQMNRRRRLSSIWGILLVPGILLVAILTVVCDRAELTIAGNGNSAYAAGHCAHLIVRGSRNKAVADNADAIDTDGSANNVIYRGGSPQISVGGTDNIVRKG